MARPISIAAIAALAFVTACSSTPLMEVEQPGDTALSCEALQDALDELALSLEEPGDGATVHQFSDYGNYAIVHGSEGSMGYTRRRLTQERQEHLTDIYNTKNCAD